LHELEPSHESRELLFLQIVDLILQICLNTLTDVNCLYKLKAAKAQFEDVEDQAVLLLEDVAHTIV
jgi:hypothetical protein